MNANRRTRWFLVLLLVLAVGALGAGCGGSGAISGFPVDTEGDSEGDSGDEGNGGTTTTLDSLPINLAAEQPTTDSGDLMFTFGEDEVIDSDSMKDDDGNWRVAVECDDDVEQRTLHVIMNSDNSGFFLRGAIPSDTECTLTVQAGIRNAAGTSELKDDSRVTFQSPQNPVSIARNSYSDVVVNNTYSAGETGVVTGEEWCGPNTNPTDTVLFSDLSDNRTYSDAPHSVGAYVRNLNAGRSSSAMRFSISSESADTGKYSHLLFADIDDTEPTARLSARSAGHTLYSLYRAGNDMFMTVEHSGEEIDYSLLFFENRSDFAAAIDYSDADIERTDTTYNAARFNVAGSNVLGEVGGTDRDIAYTDYNSSTHTYDVPLFRSGSYDEAHTTFRVTGSDEDIAGVHMGDINGDGISDVVIPVFYSDAEGVIYTTLMIYFGGSSFFSGSVTLSESTADAVIRGENAVDWGVDNRGQYNSRRMAVFDFNTDGFADIVVAGFSSGRAASSISKAGLPAATPGTIYVYLGSASPSADRDYDDAEITIDVTETTISDIANVGDINRNGYNGMAVISVDESGNYYLNVWDGSTYYEQTETLQTWDADDVGCPTLETENP